MSVLIACKLNGAVVLGTDSRTMDAGFQSPLSDATQKVYELAPGVFYATNGYRHLSEWQPAQAQALVRNLGTTDIRAIADALDAVSLPRLEELAVKVTEASSLASEHADAASGAQPIHAYILMGMSRGVPGFVARKSTITDGRIVTQSDEIFDLPEDQLRCWLTRAKLVEPITTNPWTWQWGAAAGVERLIAEVSARHPQVGGPIQMAMVDGSGARWIHQPQVTQIETNQALAGNSVVDRNVVDVSLPKLTAGVCIFTDDAVFSRGASKPVIVLNNGGLYLFGEANSLGNPPGDGGLTSKPHVIVQSTGISLMSGGDRAVTVTSEAVTLWSKNANTAYPYVQLTSTAVAIKASAATTTISSDYLQIVESGGVDKVQLKAESGAARISVYSDNGYVNSYGGATYANIVVGYGLLGGATLRAQSNAGAAQAYLQLDGATSYVSINGAQVLAKRQTGISRPSSWSSVGDALAFCQSLYDKLASGGHGLIGA